jgi:hypothetical protein
MSSIYELVRAQSGAVNSAVNSYGDHEIINPSREKHYIDDLHARIDPNHSIYQRGPLFSTIHHSTPMSKAGGEFSVSLSGDESDVDCMPRARENILGVLRRIVSQNERNQLLASQFQNDVFSKLDKITSLVDTKIIEVNKKVDAAKKSFNGKIETVFNEMDRLKKSHSELENRVKLLEKFISNSDCSDYYKRSVSGDSYECKDREIRWGDDNSIPNVTPNFQNDVTSRRPVSRKVKLPSFDGSFEAEIFVKQFKKVSSLNAWTEDEACANLMASLIGSAREILSCFAVDTEVTCDSILRILSAKYGRKVQADVARARLSELKQRRGQNLRQVGLEVEKLIGQAYHLADSHTRNILAVDSFLNALNDSDIRLQVRLSQPDSLDRAIQMAETVETALRQARKGGQGVSYVNYIDVENSSKTSVKKNQ